MTDGYNVKVEATKTAVAWGGSLTAVNLSDLASIGTIAVCVLTAIYTIMQMYFLVKNQGNKHKKK